MEQITDRKAMICPVDEQTPLAFINVYEVGDVWVKRGGCEACAPVNRRKCCFNCPLLTDRGCLLHLESGLRKPYRCVASPAPDMHKGYCVQEFVCIAGARAGKVRRVNKPRDIFDDD